MSGEARPAIALARPAPRTLDIDAVLFDLDGTLTDPYDGITGTLQYAIRQMGREPPSRDELRRYILRRRDAHPFATRSPQPNGHE